MSTQAPETRYARSGSLHIAYETVGDGPIDLVYVPGAVSHLESLWEEPRVARFFRRLASFSRLILFDKRGSGMSDRVEGVPTLEERMDDIRAVMAAAASTAAVICGLSDGGAIAALFAATYPEAVRALVLINSGATSWRHEPEVQDRIDEYLEQHWGTGISITMLAPSVASDDRVRAWWAKTERLAASPGAVAVMRRMNAEFDVRSALPAITAPTLVLHRRGNQTYLLEQGRDLTASIPGARLVELPGADHAPFFEDPDAILEVIEEFVTGARPGREPERVLATVLFTDIVGSTELATRLGDRRWREMLDQYDDVVARELERYQGTLVNTTGDGTLATFDGPARAARCACAIRDATASLGLHLRTGLHTGEIHLRGDDVTGLGVVIAQRVMSLATADDVMASSTVRDLVVGSGLRFTDRGAHELKGVPGTWQLCAVDAGGGPGATS